MAERLVLRLEGKGQERKRAELAKVKSPKNTGRNAALAFVTLAIAVPVICLSVVGIVTKLTAPVPLIADEVPLFARVLVEVLALLGALAGLVSSFLTLKFTRESKKHRSDGRTSNAVIAEEKAKKYSSGLGFLIALFIGLLVLKALPIGW